jgi:hypothetical protein
MSRSIIVLAIVLFIPDAIGTTAGRLVADEDRKLHEKGCPTVRKTGDFCTEVSDSKTLMQVFVLDVSDKYLSFYDPKTKRARIVSVDKLELAAAR